MKRRIFKSRPMKTSTYTKTLNKAEISNDLSSNLKNLEFSSDILHNEQMLRDIFKNCYDVVFRFIQIKDQNKLLLIFVDGLIDSKTLDLIILKPLTFEGLPQGLDKLDSIGQMINQQVIATGHTKLVNQVVDAIDDILGGHIAILADGERNVLLAEMNGFEKRAIDEPVSEGVVRGPREGFTETLQVNTSLLRRRIRNPQLKMESLTLGKISKTNVVITYLEGVVKDSVLEEVRKRISRIQIDGILDSGYIEEFIQDRPYSPFPQVQNTERPDVVAANLLEGKVAIITDGSPFALIVPSTFWGFLQSAEDYYEQFLIMSAIRMLRFLLLSVSLLFPSVYVAASTFHPQLIPTQLLLSIAAAREGIPFPALVEALLMEFMFEALREAGIRLPKAVGAAVSIVGALIIGEAVVSAGIISAPMVIVVSTTGIASFVIPRYNFGTAMRLLRFPMLIFAGTLGFYGMGLFMLVLLIHLVNLRSFGVPYFAPAAPQIPGELFKELFVRAPHWSMYNLPQEITGQDKQRIPEGQAPSENIGKQPT